MKRKRLESQLQQAQKMEAIGTLAGGIAHDFNNILTAIIGYAQLADFALSEGVPAKDNLRQLITAGKRAKELIRQILTFTRRSGQELIPVQLMPIVREALRFLRASLPTTIEIRQDIRSDSMILADPTSFHQVLLNLCTNAAHAMRKGGGLLDVSLTDVLLDQEFASKHPDLNPGSYVKLNVRDTGEGMPTEVLDWVFEPFFTTKGVGEATGMGLSVVHGIVRSCNGAIMAYSVSLARVLPLRSFSRRLKKRCMQTRWKIHLSLGEMKGCFSLTMKRP